MNTQIDGVDILSLEIELFGERTDTDEINLGALTIACEDREYILDVTQSYTTIKNGFTHIRCELEKDEDTFPDCPYNITMLDLMLGKVDATFFIESDLPVETISLFVKQGMTKAIDVTQE